MHYSQFFANVQTECKFLFTFLIVLLFTESLDRADVFFTKHFLKVKLEVKFSYHYLKTLDFVNCIFFCTCKCTKLIKYFYVARDTVFFRRKYINHIWMINSCTSLIVNKNESESLLITGHCHKIYTYYTVRFSKNSWWPTVFIFV